MDRNSAVFRNLWSELGIEYTQFIRTTSPEHLRAVAEVLETGRVRALKGYLGYLHHGPDDPGYRPYYELAERFRLPFIFHTGDTWSPLAKLRFAHPLRYSP